MNSIAGRILLLLFLGCFSTLTSQTRVLDSLYTVFKNHPARDTIRVQTINRIANRIFSSQPDKTLLLLGESVAIAEEVRYKKGQAYGLLFSANAMIVKGQYQSGLQFSQQSMAVFKSLNNKYGMGDCYQNFGRCHFYLGDYDKAIANYRQAISMGEETKNDPGRISASLNALGLVYAKQSLPEKALECYNRALQIDEKQQDNKFGIASNLASIGTVLKSMGNYPGALEHYNRALELKREVGDERGIASILGNIGGIYLELKKNPEAIDYYTRSLEISKRTNNRPGMASCYLNIAIAYMNGENFGKARKLFNDALEINEEIKSRYEVAMCHTNLGTLELYENDYPAALRHFELAVNIHQKLSNRKELSYDYLKMGKIYRLMKNHEKALEYADKGSAIAQSLKLLDYQRDFALLRSEIFYDQKEYKLAYENQAEHKLLLDSILKKDVYGNVADVKYQNVYKDKLNSSKTRENTLQKTVATKDGEIIASQQQKMWWILGVLGLVAVLGFVLAFVKIRKVKMENKQLLTEQKLRRSQMNPHFIFNSIQNIRSLIYNKKEDEAVNYLNKFSKLTRQILESSNENYTSLAEEIELIKNYVNIQQLLYNKAFDFEVQVDESIDAEATFLPPMLTQPFIENAIKHGLSKKSEDGRLEIRFHLKGGKLFFEVSDNGTGFEASKTPENHKSMAMAITKERLVNYSKNPDFIVHTDNIVDEFKNILGAKVSFEIPYIYEN